MRKIAILGFGAAGYNGALGARMTDSTAEIDVYTDTGAGPHNPMLTTYYIKNAIPYSAMFPYGTLEEVERRLRLRIFQKAAVTALDTGERAVSTASGEVRRYDSVLIATGAEAFLPDIPGAGLPGVFTMRTEADAVALKALLDSGAVQSGLVFGASWSGIKVAEDFVQRRIPCVLMNRSAQAFSRALFPETARRVQGYFQGQGVQLAFGRTMEKIEAQDGRLAVVTDTGERFLTDVVVVTSGVRPNLAFLAPDALPVRQGVLVNEQMETAVPGIYAAGDCCAALDIFSARQKNIALWRNAVEQGRTAGVNMAGGQARFGGNLPVSLGHCMGLDFLSVGETGTEPNDAIYTYEGKDLYIRASRRGRALRCVNIIGAAECSGAVHNAFIKSIESPDAGLSVQTICLLRSHGIPDGFIRFLGGASYD